jgi:hypothetical protein
MNNEAEEIVNQMIDEMDRHGTDTVTVTRNSLVFIRQALTPEVAAELKIQDEANEILTRQLKEANETIARLRGDVAFEVWECQNCQGIFRPPGVTECDCKVGEKPKFNKYIAIKAARGE